MSTVTFEQVDAAVRALIARYTHALDDGRTDDVVATFCPDGTFEYPAAGTATGHEALRTMYEGWKPQAPQRHLVVNTHVTDWSDTEATALSDVVLIVEGDTGWSVAFVARYRDSLHRDDGEWHFHHRLVS